MIILKNSKITALLLLIMSSCAFAQNTSIDPINNINKKPKLSWNTNTELLTKSNALKNKKNHFLTFLKIEKDISSIETENFSFQIEEIWSEHLILAYIKDKIDAKELESLKITAFAQYEDHLKLSPTIQMEENDTTAILLLISITKKTQESEIEQSILSLNGKLIPIQNWNDKNIWEIEIPKNQIQKLITIPFIKFIQEQSFPEPVNNHAIGFTNSRWAASPLSIGGHNLKGNQVTVGVGDNADPQHIDFSGRLKSFNPQISTSHGEHTTGTVGGGGIKDERYQGFAPKSNLISSYFSEIIAHSSTYREDFGMVVTNNSYGMNLGDCSFMGTYNLYSQYLDQLSLDIPDLLHVFAAANDAYLNCPPYSNGFATVNGAYSSSKNALIVANIGKTRELINTFSSKGPVKDGRLKPEITAVGSALFSTDVDNQYKTGTGTSMAAPNVAGAAVLLYERYRQLHNNQNPDNFLIKNFLMNGADDIGTIGPDYYSGFGLMNLKNSLKIMDNNQYFSDQINTNQTHTYAINIPPQTAKAKILLSWNDPAASPNQSKALINDLDLKVIGPNNVITYPLILNPDPNFVQQPALQGRDSINNTEQVVLYDPQPGNYTIEIYGSQIPVSNQKYIVSYDINKEGIEMQYPIGGEKFAADDSTYIYWEASLGFAPFSVSYSTDNGNSWNLIQNNLSPEKRALVWYISETIASEKCLIKIERGNEVSISNPFTIIRKPEIQLVDSHLQCPGNIKFYWNSISGASNYKIYRKVNDEMQVIAETTDTFFTINNLSSDSVYWFSVAPAINNKEGLRAVAKSFKPNQGNCSEINIHGDLTITDLLKPESGRIFTSSALTNNESLILRVRNQDNQIISSYQINYRINNLPWQTLTFNDPIFPASEKDLNLGSFDFSETGDYDIIFSVHNLQMNDPIPENDTLKIQIRHFTNDTMDFSNDFVEDFENTAVIENIKESILGFANLSHWDFKTNKNHGRIRSFVTSEVSIDGQMSISMDNTLNLADQIDSSSTNEFIGTFNLENQQIIESEIRFSFNYLLHGIPEFLNENQLWIRGNDQNQWIAAYNFEIDALNLGNVQFSGSISLNDILLANQQEFSSSTQVKFVQKDTSKIASRYHGNGLTIDNIKLSKVKNDIELVEVMNIQPFNCELSDSVNLSIKIKNRVFQNVHDISLHYQLNGGDIVTEHLDSLAAKDSLIYSFQASMNLSSLDSHQLSVWIHVPTDTYHTNDSILDFKFFNQQIINEFPYYQDFENNDGGFVSSGINNSWEYGVISSSSIKKAASCQKAWKTSLSGTYNPSEVSFLYSPCFDISDLEVPYLSFMIATDFEIPEEDDIYDYAYLEYSNNGKIWEKIQVSENSYQLYDQEEEGIWTNGHQNFWKVNSIPLPQEEGIISFRFVMRSDPGAEKDGIAIDDIHIYDLKYPIFNSDSFKTDHSGIITAGEEEYYIENGQVAIALKNENKNIEINKIQSFSHPQIYNADSSQFILPRMFVVDGSLEENSLYYFHFEDSLVRDIQQSTACPSCFSLESVVDLGISNYEDDTSDNLNQYLKDNSKGKWKWISPNNIRYVPYHKGYIAQLSGKYKGEFWFNNGGATKDATLNENFLSFQATKQSKSSVLLSWKSNKDKYIKTYKIQRLNEEGNFETIQEINSERSNGHSYTFLDHPIIFNNTSIYRIEINFENNEISWSPMRTIHWSKDDNTYWVSPNPVINKIIKLSWIQGEPTDFKYEIFDINGKVLLQKKIEHTDYSGSFEIPVDLNAGLYFVKISENKKKLTFKISIY